MKFEVVTVVEEISFNLKSSIHKGQDGILVGLVFQTNVLITGFLTNLALEENEYLLSLLPEGVEMCGTYGPNATKSKKETSQKLHMSFGQDKALLCFQQDSRPTSVKPVTLDQAVKILTEKFVLFQIRGSIEVKLEKKKDELFFKVDDAITDEPLFVLASQNLYLVPSLVGNKSLNEVISAKKQSQKFGLSLFERHFQPEEIQFALCITSSTPPKCVRVKQSSQHHKLLSVPVMINALCFVNFKTSLVDLPKVMLSAVKRQLYLFKKRFVDDHNSSESVVPVPEFCHFMVSGWCHPVTVCYPRNATEQMLQNYRLEFLHRSFFVSAEKPVFRRPQQLFVPTQTNLNPALISPHLLVKPPKMQHGKVYMVDGNYTYHHYKQDNFDDDGWGCAYRSLQTLVSWLKFQGYTDKPIPTHREIQKLAVKTGDRPKSFVGSKQWLGAIEVSNILSEYTDITTKIIFVNRGSEMGSIGRQLSIHFETEGSPLMIGGGVLAHTILGVSFSQVTGETQFLVLDPHYVGPDVSEKIINKGWCGWKTVKFWNQTAFYNICVPKRPSGC